MSNVVEDIKTFLMQNQNDHYHALLSGEHVWEYPSEEFEKKHELKGISQEYVLPEGKTYVDMAARIHAPLWPHGQAEKYIDILEELGGSFSETAVEAYQAQKEAELQQMENALKEKGLSTKLKGYGYDTDEQVNCVIMKQLVTKSIPGLLELGKHVDGVNVESLQQVKKELYNDIVAAGEEVFAELAVLNPELSVLTEQMWHPGQRTQAADGALSKFNVADIKSFVVDGPHNVMKTPKYIALNEKIESLIGEPFSGWLPAPSTQQRIIDQLSQRQACEQGSLAR